MPGEGVAGVVGELAAAAQGEGLDVRAVAGEDQQRVVTNILIKTAMSNAMYPSSVCNNQDNIIEKGRLSLEDKIELSLALTSLSTPLIQSNFNSSGSNALDCHGSAI